MKWHEIETEAGTKRVAFHRTPKGVWLSHKGRPFFIAGDSKTAADLIGDDQIVAPMTGKIIEMGVSEGDHVSAGQVVVTMEAMKMEYRIEASRDGVVESVHVDAEELVDQGTILVQLAEESDD